MICGIIGITRISRSETGGPGPRLTGRGFAIAGIILSSLGILVSPGLLLPVGPGTFGEPGDARRFDDGVFAVVKPESIADGLSNTVAMTSVPGARVPWTRPGDWVKEPTELFALLRQEGVRVLVVATGDGAVHTLRTDLPDDTVTAIFSREGGEAAAIDAR